MPITEQKRFLLGECVQAYLPLDDEQQREFERLATTESYKGVRAMNVTWFEKGIEKGVEKGVEKGRRELLQEQLEERFGPLPTSVIERLRELPGERLTVLGRAFVRAQSLHDLGLQD